MNDRAFSGEDLGNRPGGGALFYYYYFPYFGRSPFNTILSTAHNLDRIISFILRLLCIYWNCVTPLLYHEPIMAIARILSMVPFMNSAWYLDCSSCTRALHKKWCKINIFHGITKLHLYFFKIDAQNRYRSYLRTATS